MSIIEKLGITPGPWEQSNDPTIRKHHNIITTKGIEGNIVCSPPHPGFGASLAFYQANARLIAAAPEMLEALIAITVTHEMEYSEMVDSSSYDWGPFTSPYKDLIEKATGKSWAEIKEII